MPDLAATTQPTAGAGKSKAILGIIVVGFLLLMATILPVKDWTTGVLEWVEGLGPIGYAVYIILYGSFTVLFLPGFILTLGGGAIFGVLWGFIVVSLGSTLGACLSFLLGRFFARGMIESKLEGNQRFAAIDQAVGKQGWKIVFLTRLSPVFPFNLLNYAYGLTKVPFWHYALASWIGMMPVTLLYVYIGSLTGDVARAAVGEGADMGWAKWVMNGVGLLATLFVTIYVTKVAKKALKEAVPIEEASRETRANDAT